MTARALTPERLAELRAAGGRAIGMYAALIDALEEAQAIVRELAGFDPLMSECDFCGDSHGHHDDDCLWLRARTFVGREGE